MNYKITSMPKKNKKVKPQCSICYEDYTKSERSPVVCGHCDYSACKKCVRRYLLSKSEYYHCMNCKKMLGRYNIKFYNEDKIGELLKTTHSLHVRSGHQVIIKKFVKD